MFLSYIFVKFNWYLNHSILTFLFFNISFTFSLIDLLSNIEGDFDERLFDMIIDGFDGSVFNLSCLISGRAYLIYTVDFIDLCILIVQSILQTDKV